VTNLFEVHILVILRDEDGIRRGGRSETSGHSRRGQLRSHWDHAGLG
jgi:hypothetical protein